MYDKTADLMQPGVDFETLVRAGAERGQYVDALGRVDAWVEERLLAHRSDNVAMEQRLDNGRWLRVVERRMPDGHTVGFRMDITELKLATAAAESIGAQRGEEQRRLQSILEGTNVGTWEWNVQTGISIYNEQYVGMLGYTLAELQPLDYDTFVRLVHKDDIRASAQCMQEYLDGLRPDYEIEVRMLHKQGHWIWVLAKGRLAQRSPDGRPLWVYGTHMDITKRKLAEQALGQTSAMLQNVLDSATAVGVITLDLAHGIQVFNKGAENLLGYSAAEVIGCEKVDLFFDAAEVAAMRATLGMMWGYEPALTDVFEHVLRVRDEQEWTLQRRDGSHFQSKLIFSPMHDDLGAHVGSLGVLYDISRQKEYESSLREAMRLAEQSSLAKSQFLANMSHEIRTPMNAILGMLQLLRNTSLDSHQLDYTQKAAGAARSLLGLLNDILDFSKVEAGKMQLDLQPFVLENLLGELSVILSSNLGGKNVDLVFDVDPAIPRELVGDAMRLKQILINLAGNAVKFTEHGEVVLHCSLLSRTPEHVKLMLAVVDSGIGIAPENQSRIFNAFTQAEADTTRRFGGTGLGLVISTRLIRLMGGELELTSTLGQGSSFSFTLELGVPAQTRAPALPVSSHPAHPGGLVRAMVVDDNALALASSAGLMRSLGWEVAEASSGAQALDWIKTDLETQTQPLDAVFVDWQMPEMDGWETLRRMRRLYASAKPPLLIMLSRQSRAALSQRTDREQELLNGLMVKPLTAAMFAQTLVQARGGAPVLDALPATRLLRLAGMRILLVEDNPINQQVAQELLSAEGAQVTLAENGQLGVAAVHDAEPGFDVVLMDLQMPVMDGLSATRLLRADARFADLPIIAMTANAMHSDREECLAAGMNEHVGKPFDVQALVQTLIRHTGWDGSRSGVPLPSALPAAAPQTALPAASAEGPWPEGLEVALALARMGGNKALLQRSILAFVAEAQSLQVRLQHSLENANVAQAQRDIHAFKGLSATVGAPALSSLAAQAEKLLQAEGDSARYRQVLQELQQRMQQFLPLLSQVAEQLLPQAQPVVQHDSVTPIGPLEPAALQQFKDLLLALQGSDMGAMELHAVLRQSLDESFAEALEPLDLAMSELEFETAALECEKLVRQFGTSEQPH
jgi:PAS domain S-box-containing protein